VRSAKGKITTFDALEATSTYVSGLNDRGEVSGSYKTGQSEFFGFVREPNGTFKTISPGGSDDVDVTSINNSGTVSGDYLSSLDDSQYGFTQAPDGTVTIIQLRRTHDVLPMAINNKGEVTGYFLQDDETEKGFVWKP
jgi:hypothetical protein